MFEVFLTPDRRVGPWRRRDAMALSVGVHLLFLLGAAQVPVRTGLVAPRAPPDEAVTFLEVVERQRSTRPPVLAPAASAASGPSAAEVAVRRAPPRPDAAEPGTRVTDVPGSLAPGLPDLVPGEEIASSLPPAGLDTPIGLAAGFLSQGGGRGGAAGEPAELSLVAEIPVLRNAREMQRVWKRLYPDVLNRGGIEGEAVVSFVIGTDGRAQPGTIHLVRASHPELGEATLASVPRMRYRPARLDGRSVPVRVTLPILWQLGSAE